MVFFFFSLSSLSLSLRSTFFCAPPSLLIVFGVLSLMYIGDTRCFSFSPIERFFSFFFFLFCFCLYLFFYMNSVSFYSVDALLRFNRSISGCKLNDSANITELQKRVFFSFTFLLFWSLITLFSLLLLLLVVVCLFFFFSVCVCVSGRVEVSLIRRKWQRSCNVARCCTNARG